MNYYEMIDTIEETLDKHSSEINEVFENHRFISISLCGIVQRLE